MTISAIIIADSIGESSSRLTTLQLRYPKFIHGEFMTHRVFSRNASSSRAIPVERLIKDVLEDPVWGKNQPGMSADEEHDAIIHMLAPSYMEDWDSNHARLWYAALDRKEAWDEARMRMVSAARAFAKAGYHKQIVNRLLEPFCHINVVVTATEWQNFFALRCHPDAQPEMRILAEAIRDAMADSEPRHLSPGGWHLPYIQVRDEIALRDSHRPLTLSHSELCNTLVKISVARCARVSYLTQDGKQPSIEEDLRLYDRLVSATPLHASPAEHQATPDVALKYSPDGAGPADKDTWKQPHLHGNLKGWVQYRKTLAGECQ